MDTKNRTKRILFAEDEPDIREIIVMQVEGVVECEITECENGEEAIEILKKDPHFDLVMSDYVMPKANGGEIYEYIRKNLPHIPFFLITGSEQLETHPVFSNYFQDHPGNRYFQKPFSRDELNQNILQVLEDNTDIDQDYYRIKIHRLEKYNNTNCNIYLKLSDQKFVKIVDQNDLFDMSILEKYSKKNLNYFYVEKDNFDNFLMNHLQNVKASLHSPDVPIKDKMLLQKEIISFARDKVLELGIEEKIIHETDAVVESVINHVKENENIWKILDQKFKCRDYIIDHSLILSYLVCAVSHKMSWKVEATLKKLSIAALLHDIILKKAEHARVFTQKDLDDSKFSKEIKREILGHPLAIANMIKTFKDTYPDIDSIILCHHERPDGSGFPRKLTHLNTSPLHCLFILCEDFVDSIHNQKITPEFLDKLKEEFKNKYDKGNYKKPLEGLLKAIV